VSDRLNKSIRTILAQFGGSSPSYNAFGPGGINFGEPGGFGGGQVNKYYETPLDESMKRLDDPSLADPSLSIEKRLEVFHSDIESDLTGYALQNGEVKELRKSDNSLRFIKLLDSNKGSQPEEAPQKPDISFEMMLEAVRMNTQEKHPYEDANPPLILPTRRHMMSQTYINRGTGVTPFFGIENEGAHRSPFDKARFNTPPDGNPRSYPYRDQKEIDNYLKNPEDINFEGLYGETLSFDHPQDSNNPENAYQGMHDVIKNMLKKTRNKGNTEAALDEWRKQMTGQPLVGPGKARNMFDYFGDPSNEFNTIRGTGDKFPSSPEKAVGMPNLGFSKS